MARPSGKQNKDNAYRKDRNYEYRDIQLSPKTRYRTSFYGLQVGLKRNIASSDSPWRISYSAMPAFCP